MGNSIDHLSVDFFPFLNVLNGAYYRAFEASMYEFSIIENSGTKAIYSHTKLQVLYFGKQIKFK